MEPPHAHVPRRRPAPHRSLRLAAAAAALALTLSSSGDALLVGVLVGLAAVDMAVAATGVIVGLAVLARWGTTSLTALAGVQAVLGPAGLRGSALAAASSWCAAAALIVAAALVPRRTVAATVGLLAGLVVAGPAPSDLALGVERAAGALAGAGLAVLVAGRVSGRFGVPVAVAMAGVALVLAVLA